MEIASISLRGRTTGRRPERVLLNRTLHECNTSDLCLPDFYICAASILFDHTPKGIVNQAGAACRTSSATQVDGLHSTEFVIGIGVHQRRVVKQISVVIVACAVARRVVVVARRTS